MADTEHSIAALILARERLNTALLAANTRRGYGYDWRAFLAWTQRVGREPLPATPDTVELHLTGMLVRGLKVTSCVRRAAAITHMHRAGDLDSPVTAAVRRLLRAARRSRRDEVRRVRPITLDELRAIARSLGEDGTPMAIRDRAILLVQFCAALRSANVVTLNLPDVQFVPQGVILTAWHEKTNQSGRRLVGIPHSKHPECAVRRLREWIALRGPALPDGPLFTRFDRPADQGRALQPERICQIVQHAVARIGLDAKLYGGHTPRRSLITEAVLAGVHELPIMAASGHRDRRSLEPYFERDLWRSNVCDLIGA